MRNRQYCRCPKNYMGDDCQHFINADINPCSENPCLHEGVCLPRGGEAKCICNSSWKGINCSVSASCKDWCSNGGSCITNDGSLDLPTCKCAEGFTGSRCEISADLSAKEVENSNSNTASVIIGIFVSIVALVVAVVLAWLWQRQRGKGISHVRLEENGGTVEMTNPMYLHASDDQEDDPNPVFTLHDSPNTFKNPVYDSLYSEGASGTITQEEKTGLLQSDPLGALDTRSPNTGSKS